MIENRVKESLVEAARIRAEVLGDAPASDSEIGGSAEEYVRIHERTLEMAKNAGVQEDLAVFFERTAEGFKKLLREKQGKG